MNKILSEHLRFVYANSPFYKKSWQAVWSKQGSRLKLQSLPIVNHLEFWQANSPFDNQVFTSKHDNGIVFQSGGTTGQPKFSSYSVEDWVSFCKVFGSAIAQGSLSKGDKVANLFYGGQMYASLLFITKSIEEARVGITYPLAGFAPVDEVIEALLLFQINCIAGVPTTIINLIGHLRDVPKSKLHINKILYGGEAMYPDQIDFIRSVLPDCHIQSIGIAGVDYGEMGWVSNECQIGEFHCFDQSTVLEIVDEHNTVINEPQVEGNLVITNFRRKLMPIVRYPVGDKGMWIDEEGVPQRRFKLLGRSEIGARIGPITLYVQDIEKILHNFKDTLQYTAFQLVIDHIDKKDRCTIRIATPYHLKIPQKLLDEIVQEIYTQRHMFTDLKEKIIHPISIECIDPASLITNQRTGKLMQIVDKRHSS